MSGIDIVPVSGNDYHELSVMVGELLNEIMDSFNEQAFNYDVYETEKRAEALIEQEKYWVFLARDTASGTSVGFVSMYESYALYSEGAYGTIAELYVRPGWRSRNIGTELLKRAREFGKDKGWRRLEVTTPPLPYFERTLHFYQENGFEIAGSKKLKVDI